MDEFRPESDVAIDYHKWMGNWRRGSALCHAGTAGTLPHRHGTCSL